jgi:F-type H+-transporting ATPase subunit epsilon
MAMSVRVDIVSAEEAIFSGLAEIVIVSGMMGELGILPNHAPLLTRIKPGTVAVKRNEGKNVDYYYVSGGLLEVQPDGITILADTVVRAFDMDEAALLEARKQAEKLLAEKKGSKDYSNVIAQITQLSAKLRTFYLAKKR